jgi:hypothetical protein
MLAFSRHIAWGSQAESFCIYSSCEQYTRLTRATHDPSGCVKRRKEELFVSEPSFVTGADAPVTCSGSDRVHKKGRKANTTVARHPRRDLAMRVDSVSQWSTEQAKEASRLATPESQVCLLSLCSRKVGSDKLPVDELVEEGLDVVGTQVLIVWRAVAPVKAFSFGPETVGSLRPKAGVGRTEVVGMLPHVHGEERLLAVSHRVASTDGLVNLKLGADRIPREPRPSCHRARSIRASYAQAQDHSHDIRSSARTRTRAKSGHASLFENLRKSIERAEVLVDLNQTHHPPQVC